MNPINHARAAVVLGALALAAPASAAAVPGVFSVTAKTGNPGVTFLTDPTGALLTNTLVQTTIATDGYVLAFAEDNGVTGGGVLNYKVLPTEYRAPMSAEEKRTYPAAQTDVQAHATCSVAALETGPAILAWQKRADNDPYYNYVPWQKASAGLGDDPAAWLAVVKAETGVDLATTSDLPAACTKLGGTYHAADTQTAVADSLIANAVAPLQKQITDLKSQVSTLTKAKATADKATKDASDARKLAEVGYQELWDRPVTVTLATKRIDPRDSLVVLVTGTTTDPVNVTLELSKKQARSLGVSRVFAETATEFGSEGAELVKLKPTKAAARKLRKHKGAIRVKVLAVSGGQEGDASGKLVR